MEFTTFRRWPRRISTPATQAIRFFWSRLVRLQSVWTRQGSITLSVPSPAPEPEASHASPAPTRSPMTFTVGDSLGWMVPPNASFYQARSSGKSFMVGGHLCFQLREGEGTTWRRWESKHMSHATPPLHLSTHKNRPHHGPATTSTFVLLPAAAVQAKSSPSTSTEALIQRPCHHHPPPPVPLRYQTSPSHHLRTAAAPPSPTPGNANSAPSMAVAGLFTTFLSLAVALFMR